MKALTYKFKQTDVHFRLIKNPTESCRFGYCYRRPEIEISSSVWIEPVKAWIDSFAFTQDKETVTFTIKAHSNTLKMISRYIDANLEPPLSKVETK